MHGSAGANFYHVVFKIIIVKHTHTVHISVNGEEDWGNGIINNNKSSAVVRWATVDTIDMGLKEAGAVPLSQSDGNPSNTMWPPRRSTSVPSGVFIHPAVWPQ